MVYKIIIVLAMLTKTLMRKRTKSCQDNINKYNKIQKFKIHLHRGAKAGSGAK